MSDGKKQYVKYAALMNQGEGCDDKITAKKCGCCPPGLVSVYEPDGCHAGCLTPKDAMTYNKYTAPCQNGYIKYFSSTGAFLGCIEEEELLTILKSQNA